MCRHALARSQARRTALASPVPQACAICGYAKHVDCCHIKPVASFRDGTEAHKINALNNLTWLCPSHHWELDHHMLNFVPPSLADLEAGIMQKPVIRPARPKVKRERPGPAFLRSMHTQRLRLILK
jgi:hypothetical protein